MGRSLLILLTLVAVSACSKPGITVLPCDSDLGYLSDKAHLANVRFLQESRHFDWFELYDNIEDRRSMKPASNCIPMTGTTTTERAIEREEYSLRNLR
ncbi:MAG: hypothetical protein ACOY5B_08015 [Spirochaetota bacterium]